jgi:hypothetical protein
VSVKNTTIPEDIDSISYSDAMMAGSIGKEGWVESPKIA